jgi:hypothetical protein
VCNKISAHDIPGIDIIDQLELKTQGIDVSGFGHIDDYHFDLPRDIDIPKEIKALESSGLLTHLYYDRLDSVDVNARLTYGYPAWRINQEYRYHIITKGNTLDVNKYYFYDSKKKPEINIKLDEQTTRLWILAIMEWLTNHPPASSAAS